MKRFSLREILLLAIPVLILITGLAYEKWLRRFETPQIALKVEFKGNYRSFRRLVAFDGKTTRTLWTDADSLNEFCRSYGSGGQGGGSDYDGESLHFDISTANASWGKITFLCDTVYDINNRAATPTSTTKWTDEYANP